MEFKVRKGLETPLLIKGMYAKYFYINSALGGVLALFVFVSGSNVLNGSTSGFAFILILLFSLAIYFVVNTYFKNKSSIKKLKFNTNTNIISNRDLLKSIK